MYIAYNARNTKQLNEKRVWLQGLTSVLMHVIQSTYSVKNTENRTEFVKSKEIKLKMPKVSRNLC